MMRLLAGNARISFEGDLSDIDSSAVQGLLREETPALRRNTTFPPETFVVLPLEPESIGPILTQVLPNGRIVHAITHVQIENDGRLEFKAISEAADVSGLIALLLRV